MTRTLLLTRHAPTLQVLFLAGALLSCSDSDGRDLGSTDGGPIDPRPRGCGNGELDGVEMCDGTLLGEHTCESATSGALPGGTLGCHANCTLDMSECERTTTLEAGT